MEFDIVKVLKSQLDEQILGYIDSAIGEDIAHTTSAIRTAIPALLERLSDAGEDSHKVDTLLTAVQAQDTTVIEGFGDKLKGDEQKALVNGGFNQLSAILGDENLVKLTQDISDFSSTNIKGVSSMLGMFAPIVFSLIKKHFLQEDKALSAAALTQMLQEQKPLIMMDMPKGFIEGDLELSKEEVVTDPVQEEELVVESVEVETFKKEHDKGIYWKILSVIALLLGGYGLYQMSDVPENKETFVTQKEIVAPEVVPEATEEKVTLPEPSAAVESTTPPKKEHVSLKEVKALEKSVGDVMEALIRTFSTIKDAPSAREAVPNIKIMSDELAEYAKESEKLGEGERGLVSTVVANHMPKLQDTINKIGVIPGVGGVLRGIVIELLAVIAQFK